MTTMTPHLWGSGRRLGWMRYGEGKSGGKVGFCWPAADTMEEAKGSLEKL